MTKKRLIRSIILSSGFYMIVFSIGIIFYLTGYHENSRYFGMFKELFPILAAIPLAYLGFCFQRRSNFHSALRLLWGNMIHAVNRAILFTDHRVDQDKEYLETLLLLSKVIDEVRGVYSNINEVAEDKGLYPFESLKRIYTIVEEIGSAEQRAEKWQEANAQIVMYWQKIRKTFLAEFDRSEPTFTDTIQ